MTDREKPGIVVACSSPSWGGMEMESVLSAEALARRGYPVILLASPGTPIAAEGVRRGLPTRPVLSRSYLAPLAAARVAGILRGEKIRIVHAEFSKDLWTLVPAAKMAGGVPVVLTKHLASSVNKTDLVHRWLYGNTARVVAISSMVEENLLRRTPLPREKIVVIPNGVDLSRFPPGRPGRAETRREWEIPEGAVAIGLVGRISRGKGQLEFLRAAAMVAREERGARFLVIGSVTEGEEEYGARARDLAREIDLGDRLRFTGFREDVPGALAALDILVVPSRSEALGNVVLEGMAASLPIAAAGAAGIRDLVVDGETGILFPPDDPEAIAAALRRLLSDDALRASLGARGRERAERHFDRERRTDRIESLYEEILAGA
ncbi:MAG: glycosyltransferase family 4 protein [Candidatus Eisenbacteria bacterium]